MVTISPAIQLAAFLGEAELWNQARKPAVKIKITQGEKATT